VEGQHRAGGGEDRSAETFTIARMGVALVPQERELFPGMSVEDNLMLGAAYIPHAKDDIPNQLEKGF